MKSSQYTARKPDAQGIIHYSKTENETWSILLKRQLGLVRRRACDEFIEGLEKLSLPLDRIPQLHEINEKLKESTGWGVARVPALISFDRFFKLLANRKFPIATFIRTREELDYLQEPDIFHEVFGHCPLLTNSDFAKFTAAYGRLGLEANPQERVFLARLYWLTVEFGLIRSGKELRIYGGGILSSYSETAYALESDKPQRKPFNPMDALRTPYRIDILQPLYYVINAMSDLQKLSEMDIMGMVHEAMALGLYEPLFNSE